MLLHLQTNIQARHKTEDIIKENKTAQPAVAIETAKLTTLCHPPTTCPTRVQIHSASCSSSLFFFLSFSGEQRATKKEEKDNARVGLKTNFACIHHRSNHVMRAHIQVRERTNGPLSEVPKFLRGKNQNGFCSKMKCLYLVLNTNYITPWSRVLLENLTVNQLVKTFPVFYGTRRFITMLTRAATGSYLESEGSSPRRDNVWMNGGIVPRVLNLGRFTPGGQPVPI